MTRTKISQPDGELFVLLLGKEVGNRAKKHLGSLSHGFRKRGMGVNAQGNILCKCSHFHRQDALGNQALRSSVSPAPGNLGISINEGFETRQEPSVFR